MTLDNAVASVFSPNAIEILCKRYLQRGEEFPLCKYPQVSRSTPQIPSFGCGNQHETHEQFFERVSMGNPDYRPMLTALEFLPNSPTLFNMGTKSGGTLSACFKFDIDDTMFDSESGIMPTAMKASKVLKAGGGTGYVFSKLRARDEPVNSTHGKALGPLGVARILHVLASEITQGGKRDAAQMGILHCDHPDVESFIHWKDDNPDALGTFNISVALTDAFMREAIGDHASKPHRLLREMAQSAWRTGDPGCYFIDTAEASNPTPWAGKLTGTNPCGEVPLLNNEPCNLGSINLGKFYQYTTQDGIDWSRLESVVRLATRYLDDVLDRNSFPHPDIDAAARYTRKLGLGVCGFADLLTLMDIAYDSDRAVEIGEAIMNNINRWAHHESVMLADEKGVAPCFADEPLNPGEVQKHLRNATRTCIAPTGTIAILMGASSGIEPYFALENTRRMGDGTTFVERPWTIVDGRNHTYGGSLPKVANEIGWEGHVKMQAAFQKHTDLAVSKTINMASDVTPDDIYDAYVEMWESGCKGGTIYRDKSRGNQVLKSMDFDVSMNGHVLEYQPTQVLARTGEKWRDELPDDKVPAIRHKFNVGGLEGYVHVGTFPDGQPAELFLTVARQGSTISGMADMVAQLTSLAFQMAHMNGAPFTKISDKWIGRRFEPAGMTSNPDIKSATSLADYLGRWLHNEFAGADTPVQANVGELCPDCGSQLIFSEGCAHCVCGYERC